MTTPTAILLATDLSCRGDRALDRAALLAAAWSARLVVVHALRKPQPVTDAPSWRRGMDPKLIAQRRVQADLQGAEGLTVEVLVERMAPVPLILGTAKRAGCDLVVTGVARDETLGRMLLGTTVDALIRKSPVPVLVVKSRARGPYRKVVVATDFSEGSRAALDAAVTLFPDGRTRLFHAYDVAMESRMPDRMEAREAEGRRAQEQARSFLAATPSAQAGAGTMPVLCEYGDAPTLLDELANADQLDLVVLGSTGKRGLLGALVGSTAQRLVATVQSDVLVVPRPAH
jgi:nucleotide-binding universal stress UspA family protein